MGIPFEMSKEEAPTPVRWFVPGTPQPGGSKRGFLVKTKTGKTRVAITEDAKHNASWRAVVSLSAWELFTAPFAGPLAVRFEFIMPRPRSHYRTGRHSTTLKTGAPLGHAGKPDITKLIRSTEDALTGVAWIDDAQIVRQVAEKLYGAKPGCWITVETWPPAGRKETRG